MGECTTGKDPPCCGSASLRGVQRDCTDPLVVRAARYLTMDLYKTDEPKSGDLPDFPGESPLPHQSAKWWEVAKPKLW